MFDQEFLQRALLALPVLLFSLTIHEFFHAYAAYKLGDSTAKDMGRLTLNPIAHIDLMGLLVMILSQFRFGWAKPVPVNPFNLSNPRRDDLIISAAGPASNICLAFIFGMAFRAYQSGFLPSSEIIFYMLLYGVTINLALAFFNMIPLYPLDGSHILRSLLPEEYEPKIDSIQRFAPFLLMGLIFLGGVWLIVGPFVRLFAYIFAGIG